MQIKSEMKLQDDVYEALGTIVSVYNDGNRCQLKVFSEIQDVIKFID